MHYPKIYLVLDNCFAIKRWVKPEDWMRVSRDIGFKYIEASTDNEVDPIFVPSDYLADWSEEVKKFQKDSGMQVKNFYTGYQTYRTVGLAHHDSRVRDKLYREWLMPLVRYAAELEAGIGFSLFAFPDHVLQDPNEYEKTMKTVLEIMSRLVTHAWEAGPVPISVEQMYAPHQPPWTIEGSKNFLKNLYALTGKPSYITIDVGHQVGQKRFIRPDVDTIRENLKSFRAGEWVENMWLGPETAYSLFFDAVKGQESGDNWAISKISAEMDRYPYLFAQEEDGDTYRWLEELACYSPIIHMQQNNGISSHHAPFTEANNRDGIIEGKRLLETIARSYVQEQDDGMPPRCDEICLSFELFAANTDMNYDTIHRIQETVCYWRQFVPEDGVRLDQLL
jgi:sugar phosphate isomerase/epimerase